MGVTCLRHPESKMNPDCEECLKEELARLHEEGHVHGHAAAALWPGPDYGWRNRPPTVEELKAHPREWLHRGGHGLECRELQVLMDEVMSWNSDSGWHKAAGDWMPLTPDGFPATWPKVGGGT